MDDFISWVAESGQSAVARALGCSASLVSHWIRGRKRLTPEWAPKIELASAGRITCELLFPELTWYRQAGAVTGYRVSVTSEQREAA